MDFVFGEIRTPYEMHRHILVTGPDPFVLLHLRTELGQAGHLVETIPLETPPAQPFTLAIVDAREPSGLRRLRTLSGRGLLLALCDPDQAESARAAGADAVFYDPRPSALSLLGLSHDAAMRIGRPTSGPLGPIIGRSPALCEVLRRIESYARARSTVLITGETGTGKELVARALHQLSPRGDGPFVALNCAAIPESLVESELFGHSRGAFTGACTTQTGRLTAAAGGTLFLDEIGELPLQVQAKLLRVLQEREYTPVGESRVRKADVRVIAATNRDLQTEVSRGRFRADLYWRLDVITIELPPLRDRHGDVMPLVHHVIDRTNATHQREVTGLDQEAERMLLGHAWLGNVRELENTVERAVIMRGAGQLCAEDIILRKPSSREDFLRSVRLPPDGMDLLEATAALEVVLINQALEQTGGNRTQAARLLNINRTTLMQKLSRGGRL